jgi:CRP-like cAMP-binding protein
MAVKRDLASKIGILAAVPTFAECSRPVVADLAAAAAWLDAEAGRLLFEIGDGGDCLLVVVEGDIRLSVPSSEGKEITIASVGPGGMFGEIATLDGGGRTARATATRDSRLLTIKRSDLVRLMERHWPLAERMLALVCAHLRRTTTQIEELSFVAAPSRIARGLLRAAGIEADAVENGAIIQVTQRELAERAGVSRESTNRVLRDFERQGALRLATGRIVVADANLLRRLALSTAG